MHRRGPHRNRKDAMRPRTLFVLFVILLIGATAAAATVTIGAFCWNLTSRTSTNTVSLARPLTPLSLRSVPLTNVWPRSWSLGSTSTTSPSSSTPPTMPQSAPVPSFSGGVTTNPPTTTAPIVSAPKATAANTATTVTSLPVPLHDYDHRWDAVARCEEGGWIGRSGDAYPDSLGINAHNWTAYGGGSDLSPPVQAAVAARIEAAGGRAGYVPDQGYCAAW